MRLQAPAVSVAYPYTSAFPTAHADPLGNTHTSADSHTDAGTYAAADPASRAVRLRLAARHWKRHRLSQDFAHVPRGHGRSD